MCLCVYNTYIWVCIVKWWDWSASFRTDSCNLFVQVNSILINIRTYIQMQSLIISKTRFLFSINLQFVASFKLWFIGKYYDSGLNYFYDTLLVFVYFFKINSKSFTQNPKITIIVGILHPEKSFFDSKQNFFESNKFVHCYTVKEQFLWIKEISWLFFFSLIIYQMKLTDVLYRLLTLYFTNFQEDFL